MAGDDLVRGRRAAVAVLRSLLAQWLGGRGIEGAPA